MELRVIALNFLYAGLGVVLMYVAYRLIDIFTPSVDFQAELKNGNVAVAIPSARPTAAIAAARPITPRTSRPPSDRSTR